MLLNLKVKTDTKNTEWLKTVSAKKSTILKSFETINALINERKNYHGRMCSRRVELARLGHK